MSSTILMAIVLVVMWLVVLVPMFVRRHDDREETRSMDRFATAMRVLSRRSAGSAALADRRPYATTPPTSYADGLSPVRAAARARMLRRRRRTFATLAATAVVGLLAAVLLTSWFWLVGIPAVLLLAAYVGWLRQQVRREEERRHRRAEMFGERAASAAAGRSRPHAVPRRTRPAARASSKVAAPAPREAAAAEGRSWQPTPVPTPTYVTAPVVQRRGVPDSVVRLDDDDLSFVDLDTHDDLVDRPRAVNE
jgi:uncharacterized membrane protein